MTSATTTDRSLVHTAGALLGLLLVLLLVVRTTQAAFSDTTNEATSYDAATVVLTDDDAASSQTTFTNMIPGDVVETCVALTYDGTAVGTQLDGVRLYAGDANDTLDGDLDVVITQHDTNDCTGTAANVDTDTLAGVETDHADYTTGADAQWTPAAQGEVVSYKVEATLGGDTANGQQGESGGTEFTWEVRTSTP